MNSFVACPHCRQQVGNDGSLSGQVVACPHCRGQFTMPGIAVAPVVSAPAPFVSVKTGSTSARTSPRKQSQPIVLWIVGGAVALFMSCGLLGVLSKMGGELARERELKEKRETEKLIADSEEEIKEMENSGPLQNEPTKATYHGFIAVKVGMSVKEVEAVLGLEHETPSEKLVDGQKVKLIVWPASDVTADYEVLFLNGEVFKSSRTWRK